MINSKRSAITSVSRSREGAWIEMRRVVRQARAVGVAPARERGLKSQKRMLLIVPVCRRSREGAWIEMRWGAVLQEGV